MKLQGNVHIETYIVIYLNVEIKSLAGSFHFNPFKETLSRDENFLCKAEGECLFVKLFHRSSNCFGICNCQFQGPIFVSPILPDSSKPNVFLHQNQKKMFGCLYRFIKLILFVLIVLYHCVLILCTLGSKILHNIYFRRHGPALRFERRVLSSVGTSGKQRKGLSRKTSTCRGWKNDYASIFRKDYLEHITTPICLISHFCFV